MKRVRCHPHELGLLHVGHVTLHDRTCHDAGQVDATKTLITLRVFRCYHVCLFNC